MGSGAVEALRQADKAYAKGLERLQRSDERGAAWMLVLLWAHSARLVYLTNFPALLLTALFVPIDGGAFVFYASLVLCSAIQWAAIGLLARAILRSLG